MRLQTLLSLLSTAWKKSVFEVFLSVFSHIRTEYGEIRNISPYLVQMRENKDQKNSEYVHFHAVMLRWGRIFELKFWPMIKLSLMMSFLGIRVTRKYSLGGAVINMCVHAPWDFLFWLITVIYWDILTDDFKLLFNFLCIC